MGTGAHLSGAKRAQADASDREWSGSELLISAVLRSTMKAVGVSSPLLALDVALRLPSSVEKAVRQLNDTLNAPPTGFRFDATHLPHITLVQQFSPVDEVDAVAEAIRSIVSVHPPLRLATATLTRGGTATALTLTPTPSLNALHRRLMNQLAAFDIGAGDERAFTDADADAQKAEPARAHDVAWVTRFRTEAAYDAFDPHITLGVGVIDAAAPSITFEASTVALCALGRFCTCRQVLKSWELRIG